MKSSTRNLAVVAGVIVVLGGALAALTLTGKDGENASSLADNSINLVSRQIEDIVSMKVTNEKGGYTVVPQIVKTESIASGASSATVTETTTYVVEELGDLPMNNASAGSVLKNGFSLVASKNVGEVANLADYGLEKPKAVVQVNFKDGTAYNYSIGEPSAGDTSSYYMCGENSKNVYVVAIDDGIFNDAKDFVKKSLISLTSADQNTAPELTGLKISGARYAEPLSIGTDADKKTYISAGSTKASVDDNQYSQLVTALSSVTADDVAFVHPDGAQLKESGLDKPSAVVEFTSDKTAYKLSAGGTKDDQRYVMLDGIDAVFLIKADSVKAWAETGLFNLRSKFVMLPNIVDIREMQVTADGKTYSFVQERTKNKEKSTEDNEVYDYKVTCNGKEITYDPNFKKYYQNVIAVQLLEETDKKPEGDPVLSITYKFYDTKRADTVVQYYNIGDRRCIAVADGSVNGAVTEKSVQGLLEDTVKMSNDELVQPSL